MTNIEYLEQPGDERAAYFHELTVLQAIPAFKIVEIIDGEILTLFHGINRSRVMPRHTWLEADVKMGSDGTGTRYQTGWHSLPTFEEAEEYLSRFKKRTEILGIVSCEVADVWPKAHSPHNVYLSRWIKFGENAYT